MTWTIGRKLAAAFAAVSLVFLAALGLTLMYAGKATSKWNETRALTDANEGAAAQIDGTRQQMSAQAHLVATMDPKWEKAFQAGIDAADSGSGAVEALRDPAIARISTSSNDADHQHDAAVTRQLFPAVRRGDRQAAVAALAKADVAVGKVLGGMDAIGERIERRHAAATNAALAATDRAKLFGVIAALAALLLAGVISWRIIRGIRRTVAAILARLAGLKDDCVQLAGALDASAAGDLTRRVRVDTDHLPVSGSDELSQVAGAVNVIRDATADSVDAYGRMTDGLRGLIGEVAGAAGQLTGSSGHMAATSQETGTAVGEIATAIGEVAQGSERQARNLESARELSEVVADATRTGSEHADETTAAADAARTAAGTGSEAVAEVIRAMEDVRGSSVEATRTIRELGQKSAQITGIVETITGIAEQTNLLALNAAIEAARAGEQGRGFAVVAEEVRKLAEESQDAAASISTLIDEIQRETTAAVTIVEDGAAKTQAGAETVEQARLAFAELGASVDTMHGRSAQIRATIATIAETSGRVQQDIAEVAAVAEQSSAMSQEVSATTEQTSASTQEIARAAQELADTATALDGLVRRFTIA